MMEKSEMEGLVESSRKFIALVAEMLPPEPTTIQSVSPPVVASGADADADADRDNLASLQFWSCPNQKGQSKRSIGAEVTEEQGRDHEAHKDHDASQSTWCGPTLESLFPCCPMELRRLTSGRL